VSAALGSDDATLVEHDSTWVEVVNDLRWLDGGPQFTWMSERDGWSHLDAVERKGTAMRLLAPGAFDVHNPDSRAFGVPEVLGVDSDGSPASGPVGV
jgi:hypothetical protein